MLIPAEMFAEAQALTVDDINLALRNNDYDNGVLDCKFLGLNTNGSFVYETRYNDPDEDNGVGTGRLYINVVIADTTSGLMFIAEY